MKNSCFFFGEWQIDPSANSLRKGKTVQQVEPKAMDVLLCLCQHSGAVVSADYLLNQCWANIDTGDNPLHKTINQLRRALGDKASAPTYIETIRKRGYRTLAEVQFPVGHEAAVQPAHWQGQSPFPGLQAYTSEQSAVFYGRSEAINDVLERINQQVRRGHDFCLVLGPSGSGKSSLLQAGVIPNLCTSQGFNGVGVPSHCAIDLADVSEDLLLPTLASAMLDWEVDDQPVLLNESADSLARRMIDDVDGLCEQLQQRLPLDRYLCPRFALLIDRLEILLSSPLFDESQRQRFIFILNALFSSGAVLVLAACRNEFYPQLARYPSLMVDKNLGAHFDLTPPSRNELLQMIRLPALAAGLTWETDAETAIPLDELLCGEAATNPDSLPMLQYTLQQLYLARSDDNYMRVQVYQQLGGIEGAIGKTADDTLEELSKEQQACLPRILSLLVTLRDDDEASITSRSGRWQQLRSGDERALVSAMIERRLFVSHLQHGEACFSIAHEALLRRWPRATAWIQEHKDSLALGARLRHAAQRWLQEQKSRAYLLAPGKPLLEALALQRNPLFTLSEDEQRYIQASSQRSRRRNWLRNSTLLLLLLLTIIAAVMSMRSVSAQRQATDRRLAAENLLGFMMGDFADKLRGIGRMDLLDGITNKALQYFTATNADDDSDIGFAGQLQHAQTLEAMAEVAYSRGKNDEASQALLAARERFLVLLEVQPNNLELLKSAGANAFWIGQLAYDKADWEGAEQGFTQYLHYAQRMVDAEPDNQDALMELSYAQNSLGSVQMKRQDYDKAKNLFSASLKLKEKILIKHPEDKQLIGDIIDTNSWIALSESSQGNLNSSINILEKTYSEHKNYNNNSYINERLSLALENLAVNLSFQGKSKSADKYFSIAIERISDNIKKDSGNSSWKDTYYSIVLQKKLLNIDNYNLFDEDHYQEIDKTPSLDYNKYPIPYILKKVILSKIRLKQGYFEKSDMLISSAMKVLNDKKNYLSETLYAKYFTLILLEKYKIHKDNIFCEKAIAVLDKIKNNYNPEILVANARSLYCINKLHLHEKLLNLLITNNIPEEVYKN